MDKRTLRNRKVSERMAVVDEGDRRRVRRLLPPPACLLAVPVGRGRLTSALHAQASLAASASKYAAARLLPASLLAYLLPPRHPPAHRPSPCPANFAPSAGHPGAAGSARGGQPQGR